MSGHRGGGSIRDVEFEASGGDLAAGQRQDVADCRRIGQGHATGLLIVRLATVAGRPLTRLLRGGTAVGIAAARTVGACAGYADVSCIFNRCDPGRIAEDQSASGGEGERSAATVAQQLRAELECGTAVDGIVDRVGNGCRRW